MARHARRTSPNSCVRQRDILASAARLVKPGGRLVYVTCSLLREENEAQAEGFLAAHPDFALYPAARAWEETIGGRSPGGDDYSAPDPGAPRHRRLLRRDLRARISRTHPNPLCANGRKGYAKDADGISPTAATARPSRGGRDGCG